MNPTQSSAEAVRAADKALLHLSDYRPTERQRAQDERALARIIDQETGVGELVELLARVDSYWNPETGARLERIIGTSTCNRIRQVLSRHTPQ